MKRARFTGELPDALPPEVIEKLSMQVNEEAVKRGKRPPLIEATVADRIVRGLPPRRATGS